MADPSEVTDPGTNPQTDGTRPPPTPRWVKALALAALAMLALVVLLMLVVGGEHGPGRHLPPADTSSPTSFGSARNALAAGAFHAAP
jgi:hypothetical protein